MKNKFIIALLSFPLILNCFTNYSLAADKKKARSFETLLSRNDQMCEEFGSILTNDIPRFDPEALENHPMFETFKKIEVPRQKVDAMFDEESIRNLYDTVYTVENDINNDGIKERLFRSELLQGRAVANYFIIENVTVLFEPYPRMDGEEILPNSPWFMNTLHRNVELKEWEDWMSFDDFPRSFPPANIDGDDLEVSGLLRSDFIKTKAPFLFNFSGTNVKTVILKYEGRNYLAPLYSGAKVGELIYAGIILEYKNKKVTPFCITNFSDND
ncbi:MAG: hypothetical protein P8J14_10100 [Emcibacteraceae bacterium]|nr:hypothetical protein [Emcibacteraceae bacterium]